MASRLNAAGGLVVLLICIAVAVASAHSCPRGYKTCAGSYRKCRTNIYSDVKNCGRCGAKCSTTALPHATTKCKKGVCTLVCKKNYGNCDGVASTGCEINLLTNPNHCGRCNKVCTASSNTTATCVKGRCKVNCNVGLTQCSSGCEDLMNDKENCGQCGRVCPDEAEPGEPGGETVFNVTGFCDQGQCRLRRCFPGDAMVTLEYGKVKQMTELELGDKVAVMKHDGSVAFEDVYAFGHRDASATSQFVRLTLEPIDEILESSRNLELTSLHFVPISGTGGNLMYKRARDVRKGDKMWVHNSGASTNLYIVASISHVTKQGLYNPYTLGGTIIVNGVAASSHSDWFLDDVFEALDLVHWLPSVYQTVLLPVRILYRALSKDLYVSLYQRLYAQVDVADVGGSYSGSVVTFGVASAVAAFLMSRAMSKKA